MKKISVRITDEQAEFLESIERKNSDILRDALNMYITIKELEREVS